MTKMNLDLMVFIQEIIYLKYMMGICNKYCIKYNRSRKFKDPKISYIFYKILVFSIIFDKCGSKDETVFK